LNIFKRTKTPYILCLGVSGRKTGETGFEHQNNE
jgi:hypothetical protein